MNKTKRRVEKLNTTKYIKCASCFGHFNPRYRRFAGVKNKRVQICAWCSGRNGETNVLFIQFVQRQASLPCEADIHGPGERCNCTTCLARSLVLYAEKKVGYQLAPIKTKGTK